MLTNFDEVKKIEFIWLTSSEAESESVHNRIKARIRKNKANGIFTVSFISGFKDLTEQTALLLANNIEHQ